MKPKAPPGKKRPQSTVAKASLSRSVNVRVYPILVDRIEAAIDYGWHRAHKHVDNPNPDAIRDAVHQAVINELCELFDFGDP